MKKLKLMINVFLFFTLGCLEWKIIFVIAESNDKVRSEINFFLYTRSYRDVSMSFTNVNHTNPVDFNTDIETQIFIHGWLHSKSNFICAKDGLLKQKNCNVIIVDWQNLAFNEYHKTAKLTVPVGEYIASVIDNLVKNKGLKLKNLHIIGHSFGAHIAGIVGNRMKSGNPSRITGLDPSLVPFQREIVPLENKLDITDADCVQVVHTGGGKSGIQVNIGRGDFYPNGGITQPGCHIVDVAYGLCSHLSALKYLEQWSENPHKFEAIKCGSWNEYKEGECSKNPKAFMVENTNRPCPNGSYYLMAENTPLYFNRRKCSSVSEVP